MATTFSDGDRVKIKKREQTAADIKSGLYYNHFGGLRGTILKTFTTEASILVDRDTLPASVRERHEESEKNERQKYLDRLSEDARSKASAREKNFALHYSVLVGLADLETDTAPRATSDDLEANEAAFLAQRNGKK